MANRTKSSFRLASKKKIKSKKGDAVKVNSNKRRATVRLFGICVRTYAHAQFRMVVNNYNQTLEELKLHFSK